jgi:hypothetical protein
MRGAGSSFGSPSLSQVSSLLSSGSQQKPPAFTAQVAFCFANRAEIWYTILGVIIDQLEASELRLLVRRLEDRLAAVQS